MAEAVGRAAVVLLIVVPPAALLAMHLQMGLRQAAATAEAVLKARSQFQASRCCLTAAAVAVEVAAVTRVARPVICASP